MIVLQLKSTIPMGKDASPADASATVKKVLGAIDVPLIVWGCANPQKMKKSSKKSPKTMPGREPDHRAGGRQEPQGYRRGGHGLRPYLISSSPIDVNLAKQVNILLENLGMPMDKVIVDPTTGGLGYGLEYSYSVMERSHGRHDPGRRQTAAAHHQQPGQ
jgi:acetyl-CoA decarbonylase/synthase complex subunit delta